MNERRLARLKQQIKQRLAEVLHRDLADPKLGMVTITRIELDTEFSHCKAYWSVLAGSDQEEKAKRDSAAVLGRARGFCQREMARVLHTRSVPHLEFLFDEGIGAAIRMNKLLDELKPEAEKTGEATAESTAEATTEGTTTDDASAPESAANAANDTAGSDTPGSDSPSSDNASSDVGSSDAGSRDTASDDTTGEQADKPSAE
ncbi:MAG: ribosome-binding factor A [Planctomycetota bacterium]|jgi:ribosome-binding factor A